jgi:hypothetical protein
MIYPLDGRYKSKLLFETLLRGYGLVVECVLAKDETGVRFSLSAPTTIHANTPQPNTCRGSTGDRGSRKSRL